MVVVTRSQSSEIYNNAGRRRKRGTTLNPIPMSSDDDNTADHIHPSKNKKDKQTSKQVIYNFARAMIESFNEPDIFNIDYFIDFYMARLAPSTQQNKDRIRMLILLLSNKTRHVQVDPYLTTCDLCLMTKKVNHMFFNETILYEPDCYCEEDYQKATKLFQCMKQARVDVENMMKQKYEELNSI